MVLVDNGFVFYQCEFVIFAIVLYDTGFCVQTESRERNAYSGCWSVQPRPDNPKRQQQLQSTFTITIVRRSENT